MTDVKNTNSMQILWLVECWLHYEKFFFIKFRLPDEKFTCMGEVCMGMAFMGVTCMGGACMGQGVAIDQIYENS